MSIDMSQFHGVFIEESNEHLDEMENLLMSLDIETPDIEELNSIFRAAHSIKGGSGIFGFDALISVTHVMENLFDKARQNKFTFNKEVVDQLLEAVDALRSLLDAYKNDDEPDWNLVNQITVKIEALLEPSKETVAEDGSFGFFEPNEEEQGFGFFSDPVSVPAEEDGFGFFDDESADEDESVEPKVAQLKAEDVSQNEKATDQIEPFPKENVTASKQKAVKTKSEQSDSSSIRVDISKVDSLVNMAGELVITQSMLNLIGAEVEGPAMEKLQSALVELERNTRELQEGIMSIRMLPISFVFNRFPRVVRDLSSKLNKKVNLVIEGGHTEIDKGLIERLVDPLTHLVRNSLDHGIESPEARSESGKDPMGSLVLKAEQKGGNIIISVTDDGAGLNKERILKKASENGIELPENLTEQQVWELVMAPGFSTAAEVTDVSGRGVGMDVVKRNIEAMSGRIEIESQSGAGSTFQIRLPLTLAILDGMSVAVGQQLFIIPLVNIIESVQPSKESLKNIGSQTVLELRDAYWPIIHLHEFMQVEPMYAKPDEGVLVLIETTKTRFALLVDDLVGQQQVVIKSLEQHYRRVPGVAGATIMGDGSVALILDVESMASEVGESVMLKDEV
ncbi:chemotaxis protein CheA [Colwelliaceae bacterium 6471]